MPSLAELQARFADYLADGDTRRIAELIRGHGHHRLSIHRNNRAVAEREALRAGYPVAERLLGERCFMQLARRYGIARPAQEGSLIHYGAALADWLPEQPELVSMPWLADVARLEWALQRAHHAADGVRLSLAALSHWSVDALAAHVIRLHPSVERLSSRWPVAHIWTVNQVDWTGVGTVSLDEGGVRLVITRDIDGHVGWRTVTLGVWTLIDHVAAGRSLGDACEAAAEAEPDVSLLTALSTLIEAGVFLQPGAVASPHWEKGT